MYVFFSIKVANMLTTINGRNSIKRFDDHKTFRFQIELHLSESPLSDMVGIIRRACMVAYLTFWSWNDVSLKITQRKNYIMHHMIHCMYERFMIHCSINCMIYCCIPHCCMMYCCMFYDMLVYSLLGIFIVSSVSLSISSISLSLPNLPHQT